MIDHRTPDFPPPAPRRRPGWAIARLARLPAQLLALFLALLLVLPVAPRPASAQAADDSRPSDSRPSYGGPVGRVALAEGAVELRPSPADDLVAAPGNYPLAAGARLSTGRDGRLELEFPGLLVWLAAHGEIIIGFAPDGAADFEIVGGRVAIQRLDDGGPPPGFFADRTRIELKRAGVYRIDFDRAGISVRVDEGLARVESGVSVAYLTTGQRVEGAAGQLAPPTGFDLAAADDFDRWVAERLDPGDGDRYASSQVPGWRELDGYGAWESHAEFGNVWYPAWLPAGWAPYRSGHWVWLSAWGWTWVDSAPWGFVPAHFGHWTTVRGRWCWVPGASLTQLRFAPAVVHFHDHSGRQVAPPRHRHERPHRWSPRSPASGQSSPVVVTAGDEQQVRAWPAPRRGASLSAEIRGGSGTLPGSAAAGGATSTRLSIATPPPADRPGPANVDARHRRDRAGYPFDDSRQRRGDLVQPRGAAPGGGGRIEPGAAPAPVGIAPSPPAQGRHVEAEGKRDGRRWRQDPDRARQPAPPQQRAHGKELWQQWQTERQAEAAARTPPPPVYPGMPKADRERSERGSGTGDPGQKRWQGRRVDEDERRGSSGRNGPNGRPRS